MLRLEETSEDSEGPSVPASVPTTKVSEVVEEVRDQITAIAVQSQGQYQAIGDEAGVVSVVDSSNADEPPTELWRTSVPFPIGQLGWSGDGQHLACTELTGKVVVKRVHLGKGSNWTVTSSFNMKLDVSSEGIQQILLNNDGSALLVKNGPSVTVWPLGQTSLSANSKSITAFNMIWCRHPADTALLLGFGPSSIKVYRWDDLSDGTTFDVKIPHSLFSKSDATRGTTAKVFFDPTNSTVLVDTAHATKEGTVRITYSLNTSMITLAPTATSPPTITSTVIPQVIQDQIEIHLGILSRHRLTFLDKDHWMCT